MAHQTHVLRMHGWEPTPVGDFAEASAIFMRRRDESGQGASEFSDGHVENPGGIRIGSISYNGRVWGVGRHRGDKDPIWDSRDPAAHPAAFPHYAGRSPKAAKPAQPPKPAQPKTRYSGHPAGPLTARQRDRLDHLHHEMLNAIEAMRGAGASPSYDDVVHLFVKAYGQSGIHQLKQGLVSGRNLTWNRNDAAAALAARMGITPELARIVCDEALMDIAEHAVTYTELPELVADGDPRARQTMADKRMDGQAARRLADAGVETVADLVAHADALQPDDLECALNAITRAWSGGRTF